MRKQQYRGLVAIGVLGMVAACATKAERADESRQSLIGTDVLLDTQTKTYNTVVSIHTSGPPFSTNTERCSGTLISPGIVLTARHCIYGDTTGKPAVNAIGLWVAVGQNYATPLAVHRVTNFASPYTQPTNPLAEKGSDYLILFLDTFEVANAYAFRPSLTFAPVQGSCSPGQVNCNQTFDGISGAVGFSPAPGDTQRRLVRNSGQSWDGTYDSHGGVQWASTNGAWQVQPGDSGGLMYFERQAPIWQGAEPGQVYRDVMGATFGSNNVNTISYFTSVVHDPNKSWLVAHVEEATSPLAPLHSAAWLTQHGKTGSMWKGEVDYIGECRNLGSTAACLANHSSADRDCDCDHWFDHGSNGGHDNCPFTYNPEQADAFEFKTTAGIAGDACRTCPSGDTDGDGVCDPCTPGETNCTEPVTPDNCVNLKNGPQLNTNALAEIANGRDVLGDDCDPVPVAKPDPDTRETNVNCTVIPNSNGAKVCSSSVVQDDIIGRTVGSHVRAATVSTSVNVAVNATNPRFCQSASGFDCSRPDAIRDSEVAFWASDTAEQGTVPAHPWHRVTTKYYGTAFFDPRGYAYPNWNYGSTVSTLRWAFASDLSFWLSSNPARIPAGCTNTSCLDGMFWLNSDTDVGRTADSVNGMYVGLHGADLSNAYEPIDPDWGGISYCTAPLWRPVESTDGTNGPKPKGLILWPKGQLDLHFGRGEHNDNDYLMPTSLNVLGVVGEDEGITTGNVSGQNCGSSPIDSAIQATTLANNVDWLSPVEPSSAIGSGSDAIALSADGRSLVMHTEMTPSGMVGTGYDVAGAPGSPAPQPTEMHVAAYSRGLRAVFVGGGIEIENKALIRSVWMRPVVTPSSWVEVTPHPGGGFGCTTCGDVADIGGLRAFTYSYTDEKMWFIDVIDVSGIPKMRLARASLNGSIEQLAVWSPSGSYQHYYLNLDRNGEILVSFASKDYAYRVLRIALDPSTGGVLVTNREGKDGESLVAEPTISSKSYGFLLTSDGRVAYMTRTDSLSAITPTILSESL